MSLPSVQRQARRVHPGRAFALASAALAVGLVLAGCGCSKPVDRWPDGALLLADTGALRQLLGRLSRSERGRNAEVDPDGEGGLDGTPLSRHAAALSASLPGCPLVEGRATTGRIAELWDHLQCRDTESVFAPLRRARGDRDVALVVPYAATHAIVTLAVFDGGDVALEVRLPEEAALGLAGLAVPGARPPGTPALSDGDSLVHVRIRPANGLDLASLVPDGSQGAQLFRLKSTLFSGLVLDGVWEAAVYVPEPGRPMPRAALALGFSRRGPAVSAMESFIADLQTTWPVQRTPFRVGVRDAATEATGAGADGQSVAEGACLLDLNVLPDLAPCYVATDRSLIVGWNPGSVRKALDGGARELAGLGDASGAVVRLHRFPEADRILSDATGESHFLPRSYPWQRVVARGGPKDSGYRVRVQFESRPST